MIKPEHHRPALRTLAYVVLCVATAYALYLTRRHSEQLNRQAITDQYLTCLSSNDTRMVLADLLALSATQPPPDYTKVPSFDALDPETKAFLLDVTNRSRSGGADTEAANRLREFVREKLPQRDCKALFPKARH